MLIFLQASCAANRNIKRIIVASAGKIESLDPAQANTLRTLQLLNALGDTLYEIDNKGNLIPSLAKDLPTISKNGLILDIPLRKGISFHDGTPFNSEAMAFSLRRFIKIGTLNYLLNTKIKEIETPNKYLLRLKLSQRSSSILGLLTSVNLTPVSPTSYSKYKDKFLNRSFIGTGPYKLSSFSPQQQKINLYHEYWGEKPLNIGIDYVNFNSSSTLFSAMRTGEIDVLLSNSVNDIQRIALSKLSKKSLINEGQGPATEIGFITFKSNQKPFNNKNVRRALSYSIDRELISQKVSFGLREPSNSIIPYQYRKGMKSPWPNYNPENARKLLTKEGFCDEKSLILPLTFRSNVPADKLLALTWREQIKRDLSDCIKITLNGVESTTVYKLLADGAFEAVILDWTGAYPDPEAYLSPLISCTQINNNICTKGEAVFSGSFWGNKENQILLENSEKVSKDSRLQLLLLAEKNTSKGAAYLPVWLVKPRAWSQTYISQPTFNANGMVRLERLKRQ